MADIKFLVSVDTKTGQASLKEFEGAVDGLGKTGEAAGTRYHDGLIAKIAAGVTVYNLATKAGRALIDIGKDAIQGAIDQEQADNDLNASLELSGRTVAGNYDHYLKFAQAQQLVTRYRDEEIEGAQTLLLQLLDLDQKGIDRATKASMGLASVMHLDLQTAAMMVGRAINNDADSVARLKIHVDESLPPQQKQAAILAELEKMYGRSTSEINTFGGSIGQMKKAWEESLETLGTAVTKNEGIQKIIREVTKDLQDFVSSGEAEKFADTIRKVLDGIVTTFNEIKSLTKGPLGWGQWLAEDIFPMQKGIDDLERNARIRMVSFRDSLQIIKPTMEEMREEALKGEPAWAAYTARILAMDQEFVRGKGPITDWMKEILGIGPGINETGKNIQQKSVEIAKFIRDMNTDISKSTKSQFDAARDEADAEYKDRLAAINKMKGSEAELASARQAAAAALSAKLVGINRNEADAVDKLNKELNNKIQQGYLTKFEAARAAADNEYKVTIDNIRNTISAGAARNEAEKLAARARAAEIYKIDKDEADHRIELQKKIADGAKQWDQERRTSYLAYTNAAREAEDAIALLGKQGLSAKLLEIRQEAAAKAKAIKDDESMAKENKKTLLALWKGYYDELEALAKKSAIIEYTKMAWDAIAQMASSVLSNMSERTSQYYSDAQTKLSSWYDSQYGALDKWYQDRKAEIDAEGLDEAAKAAALKALDADYYQKKQSLQGEQYEKEKQLKKLSFEEQKQISLTQAWINMASAVLAGYTQQPFIPVGLAAGTLAAALSLIQIGNISRQTVPLARGAILTRPTFSADGRFEAGEDGPEGVIPLHQLPAVMKSLGYGGRSGGPQTFIINSYIGTRLIKREIINTVQDASETGGIQLRGRSIRRGRT